MPYSCTAAVAQMVTQYYGIKLSHRAAIELAGCQPDGATLSSVAKALKKSHGLRHRTLRKQSEVREALVRGEPVMSNDALTYENDHAILVIGATAKGFEIAYPLPMEFIGVTSTLGLPPQMCHGRERQERKLR